MYDLEYFAKHSNFVQSMSLYILSDHEKNNPYILHFQAALYKTLLSIYRDSDFLLRNMNE